MEYIEETALQKEPEITVLKVEPGKAPEEVTIPNTLEAMQQMVGGLIEIVYLDDICLVCNEEGKLMGLEGNRRVGRDIISGTFFLTGDTDYGEFCSLTQEQRAILKQAAEESSQFQRKLWAEKEAEARKILEGKGVKFMEPDRMEFAERLLKLYKEIEGTEIGELVREIKSVK